MRKKTLLPRKKISKRAVPRSSYHEVGIKYEDMKSEFKAVTEAVIATKEELGEKINELRTELKTAINELKISIEFPRNSLGHEEEIRQLKAG